MTTAAEQEQRARDIADTTRRYLTALNTGGIAMTFAVAGALASEDVEPRWTVIPVALFVIGLVITGLSHQLAKYKAIKRRDAAQAGAPAPDFTKWLWRNSTWDWVPLVTFVVAIIVGLWELSFIQLPGK